MNIAICKCCKRKPIIVLSSFSGLIEVYCKCKKNKFVGYGDNQQEAVSVWNEENLKD